MFEHRHQPIISRKSFLQRQFTFFLIAFAIVLGSLGIGMCGYHFLEGLGWIDALLNSAMILGGMGQVNSLTTDGGKIFASFFALYSGVIFLVVVAILFAPIFHRVLHHFHLESDKGEQEA